MCGELYRDSDNQVWIWLDQPLGWAEVASYAMNSDVTKVTLCRLKHGLRLAPNIKPFWPDDSKEMEGIQYPSWGEF
jgi:hypothetical protein